MVSPGAWRSRAKAQNKACRVILGKSLNFSESPLFTCKKKLKNPCVPYRVMVRRCIVNSISARGQMVDKQQRFFLFSKFFLCGPFLLFIEVVIILLLYYGFFFFGFLIRKHGILVPRPRIELAPPTFEGEILTTRPPGKSQ